MLAPQGTAGVGCDALEHDRDERRGVAISVHGRLREVVWTTTKSRSTVVGAGRSAVATGGVLGRLHRGGSGGLRSPGDPRMLVARSRTLHEPVLFVYGHATSIKTMMCPFFGVLYSPSFPYCVLPISPYGKQ